MQFAGGGNCPTLIRILKESMDSSLFGKIANDFEWPWYMPDAESYEDILSSAGFRQYRVWIEDADRYFRDEHNPLQAESSSQA